MPSSQPNCDISVVVPVFNEMHSVAALHREILDALRSMGATNEIIFVDDGSNDGTFETLCRLRPIKIVRLRKNSGQSAALDAGIKQAVGRWVITLDGDGQNDPRDFPALMLKVKEGYDMVCGWRRQRRDPLLKRATSRGAGFLRRFLVDDGVHDAGCTLRMFRRECFEDLDLYAELHRMVPALVKWRGFRISEVPVSHRPRTSGRTKYTWRRTVNGFLDMVYVWFWRKYSARPLHLFGAAGLCLIGFGTSLLLLLAYLKIFHAYMLSNKIWPLVGFFCLLIGVQLLVTGLLAANLVDTSKVKKYFIDRIIEQ